MQQYISCLVKISNSKIVFLTGAYDKKSSGKSTIRMLGVFWCKFWRKTKTELCRYLGYARVVNSVSHQLTKLITDNQVIEINKKYHLK